MPENENKNDSQEEVRKSVTSHGVPFEERGTAPDDDTNPLTREDSVAIDEFIKGRLQGRGPAVFRLYISRLAGENGGQVFGIRGANAEAEAVNGTKKMGRLMKMLTENIEKDLAR